MHSPRFKLLIRAQYVSLVLPCLLLFTVGLILPMILGVYYSLTSWDGYSRTISFVGIQNFIRGLSDPQTLDAWWFTIRFAFWNTLIQNVFALFFALILDTGLKGKTFYRTVLFLPCLIAPIVAGFIWQHMYFDVFPAFNTLLGTKIDFRLFGKASTVLSGVLIVNNWQFVGYWMLIYLAALQSIPQELYESAFVDGAGFLTRFFRITVPMLAPAFTICIVGITIGSMSVYALLVSATNGGPGRASTSIIYHIYNTALNARQTGYGSALSILLVVFLLIIAVVQLGALRRREVQL
ncbi:MAG TPA: sugar ABC transporter permease [Spirochaetia bacterium]|nr:sugar ABC transporter permease [Spirochaetia bacterium]